MAITEQIKVYAHHISSYPVDGDASEVTLSGVDTDDVLANYPVEEIVSSLIAQDKFSELVDIVTKRMEEDDE